MFYLPESGLLSDARPSLSALQKYEKLQATEMMIKKVCNFQELLDVRHSVMLLGPAGCAKTDIWKVLSSTWNMAPEDMPMSERKKALYWPKEPEWDGTPMYRKKGVCVDETHSSGF